MKFYTHDGRYYHVSKDIAGGFEKSHKGATEITEVEYSEALEALSVKRQEARDARKHTAEAKAIVDAGGKDALLVAMADRLGLLDVGK